ncbi:MAG: polyprenyl synthetase family protein [Muribaculaceae bacterium]|nr:polyprenyl synthetase family protein [Muribaculaceae bacterium]
MAKFDSLLQTLKPELTELNRIMKESLNANNELMDQIIATYLKTKGKQIRPILVILSAKMLGEVNDHVLYAAAALEMLHNASLIHDDVVDETKLRRGVPTINNTWDNHIAVLVGDFFVSTALSVGIHTGRISVLDALSELGKELSLGEIDQICNAQERHLNETAYLSVIRKKTASLFMKCVQLGAETGDARPEEIAPMVDYAELLGLCFQIKDDIFDYFEDEKIGKPTGNDLREGKVTLPLLYALNHGKGDDVKEINDLVQRGDLSEEEIARLIEFAKREGGIDYAYAKMHDMQRQADEIICRYLDNDARKAFRDIFEFIIHRDK